MDDREDFDLNELNDAQKQTLEQFITVTSQEHNVAIPLLRKCQWNLQIAIARFFDGDAEEVQELETPATQPRRQETLASSFDRRDLQFNSHTPSQVAATNNIRHRIRPAYEPAPRVVGQPENRINPRPPLLLSALLTPFNLALSLFKGLFNLFSHLFPFLPRLLSRLSARATSPLHRPTNPRPPLSPYDTALRFHREFTESYGAHPLPLLESSYAHAYDLAKQTAKFLLVVPISPEHPSTDAFVRTILLSPPVVTYLTDPSNDILLWAGSVADSEPYQVATALSVTTFPAAVLIAHTPDVGPAAMSIVARVIQPRTPDEFVTPLRLAHEQHSAALREVSARSTAMSHERKLREEQNDAFTVSLRKDQEKKRRKREAEEEVVRQEKVARDVEERRVRYERDLAQWRRWRAARLAAEPDGEGKDVVKTSIRLLGGEKVMRSFDAAVGIEEVYAFVECFEEVKAGSHGEVAKPTGFKHEYGFRLVAPLPREVFEVGDGRRLGEVLGRRANLIAERKEEEEEEEEE